MATQPYAVNARFVNQSVTGVQRYCIELTQALNDGVLIAPRPAMPPYRDLEARVSVTGGYLTGHPWEQFVLPLAARRYSALFSPAGWGPLSHPNHVLTIHDLAPLDTPECFSRAFVLWYSKLVPLLAKRVRRIITVSQFCKQRMMEAWRLPENKITVAGASAGIRFFPRSPEQVQQAMERFGLRAPYFFHVGALSPRKNLPRLLSAWSRVVDQLGDATLVIAAKWPLRTTGSYGLSNLPKQVKHLTTVNDEDLVCLLTGAQGLLYPSLYEGFGLPILEAMACGCPVLTSNCTSMPEIAGDAAILVDPLSEESIADGIRRLACDACAQDLRAKGFQRSREFSWSGTAQIVNNAILS